MTPGLIAELACGARNWDEVERETTRLLMDAIGGDTVFFAGEAGLSVHAVGVVESLRPLVQPVWRRIQSGARTVLQAALNQGGAVVDSELLGSALERVPYYQLMMRPVRGHSTLIGVLSRGGQAAGKVAIGRCRGSSRFRARHRADLASILPTLALAQAAHQRTPLEPASSGQLQALTPREREVLDFVRLGYTNQQIGSALGTRPRTVRNQLSRVYQKLGVATRAEALAVAHGLGTTPLAR